LFKYNFVSKALAVFLLTLLKEEVSGKSFKALSTSSIKKTIDSAEDLTKGFTSIP